MPFEFGDTLNWNLVTRENLTATKVTTNPDLYGRIRDISFTANNRILMVGCRSQTAKSTWWLGCRIAKRLFISPSSTSDFFAAVYTESFPCPLDTLTLIKFEPDGPTPYLATITVPRWITHLYIEIWEYDGPDDLAPN